MDAINRWLWVLPALAQLGVIVRLLRGGELRRHVLLLSMLIASLCAAIAGSFAEAWVGPKIYARIWVVLYLLLWSLTALALTEACTTSMRAYERFGQIGERIVRSVLIGTGLVIAGWLLLAPPSWTRRFIEFFIAQGHIVNASLAFLGATVLLFATWAKLKLHNNARLTMITLSIFCAGEAILASGVSAAWPSPAFYAGIAWATLCWSMLALAWRPVEAASEIGTLDETLAPPALAQMDSASNRLADLLRRG